MDRDARASHLPDPPNRSITGDPSPTGQVGSASLIRRRSFLTSALALSGGLLVPEWLLDPPKGRSMVSVPGMPKGIWSPVAGLTFYPRTDLTFVMGLRPAPELHPVYGRFEPYYLIDGREFSKLTYDAVYRSALKDGGAA